MFINEVIIKQPFTHFLSLIYHPVKAPAENINAPATLDYEDAGNEEEKHAESPVEAEQEEVPVEEPAEPEGPPQPGKFKDVLDFKLYLVCRAAERGAWGQSAQGSRGSIN